MKRILITGAEGMVGSQARFGIRLSKKALEVTSPVSIERAIKKYAPDAILHLAAMTNIKECEQYPKKAQRVNAEGTKNLAAACKKHGIKLVYLSTCVMFDGKKRVPYRESDTPKPLNIYGKTKFLGETMARKILPDMLIVRTGWLFGGGKVDARFVHTAFRMLKAGEAMNAVSDRHGSPTYVPDLLDTIKHLIDEDKEGIYHVVNDGVASYFDIARAVKRLGKFSTAISPVTSSTLENPKLRRGKMEALQSRKVTLRSWKSALKEYIRILKRT